MPERIETLEDPRLDPYRSLKVQNAVRDAGLFIAEGPTVVERVLRSSFQTQSIVIADRKYAAFESRLPDTVPVYRLSNALAEQLVGFDFHCGVVASVRRRPSPPARSWLSPHSSSLILAGDRITDPENVGALIRIASAFGAACVVLGKGSADPFSRRVLRVSMGNVLFVPVVETDNLAEFLQTLVLQQNCSVCSTVLHRDAVPLSDFRFPNRTVLLFGNEYDGVSAEVLAVSTSRLTIPMANGTDSLNVAVSAGIFAWQFRTQHPAVSQACGQETMPLHFPDSVSSA